MNSNISENLINAEPCPFCGNITSFKVEGKTQKSYVMNNDDHKYYDIITFTVRCNRCYSRGPTASVWLPRRYNETEYYNAQNQAIEKWNQRILSYKQGE